MLTKQNIVIISSIDWAMHWQIHHQLATFLIEKGNRVLFVENTGARSPRVGDIGRIWERILTWWKSTKGYREIRENLIVYSPLFLPFPNSKLAKVINRLLISTSIRKWLEAARFYDPIVITFLPTPLSQSLIDDIDPVLRIYYCVDNMSGSSNATKYLKEHEERLFHSVDLVFVTSGALFEKANLFNKNVHLFPAGVDYELFEKERLAKHDLPKDLANIKKPIIGYIGALSGVFDQDLVCDLAKFFPHANIVLVGPKYTDLSKLESHSNIIQLGMKPHDEIPSYIKGFDVALIPYLKTEFTDSVYSCKLNEYLAMGVPVVTTDLNEMRTFVKNHGDILIVAKDKKEFIEGIRKGLREKKDRKIPDRISVAKSNGWTVRLLKMSGVLENALVAKSGERKDWQKQLVKLYQKGQYRMIKISAILILAYFFIFYTPFAWFMSRPLMVNMPPAKAEAIVVLGGYGEKGWENLGFQKRVKEALNLYHSGYAKIIIVSSGENYDFREVDMMQALLKEEGVPDSAIIPDFGAGSTFESVIHVKKIMNEKKIKSAILVTSKFHMRRAYLTCRKNAPEINIIPAQMGKSDATVEWGISYDYLKVILYEYSALLHNWFTDRI